MNCCIQTFFGVVKGMVKKPTKRRRKAKEPVPVLASTVPDRVREPGGQFMVGYARVSTSDQSVQRQVDELVKFGVAAVDIFSDMASGKNMDRPGWELCNKMLEAGDMLVVHSLDRLGRNLEEVIKVERDLRERNITLKVLAQDINTATASGRLVFHILMTVAEFEREWGRERIMHGIQKARERGIKGGSDPKYTNEQIEQAMANNGGNLRLAAREIGCSKVTVMRRWNAIQAAKKGIQG
jgi:DNA invertase Pin-like site-specific DNA recombinase